jgi:Ca2+-binding EF-hand superfamily protein
MRALLVFLVLLAMPLPSLATGPNSVSPKAFSVHDQNHDGYLSREEYTALRTRCQEQSRATGRPRCTLIDFDTLDTDHDDHISEEELVETLGRRYRGGRDFLSP